MTPTHAAKEASEEGGKHDRASPAYCYAGEAKVAAHALLPKSRSAGSEEMLATLVGDFPPKDQAAVPFALATAAALAAAAVFWRVPRVRGRIFSPLAPGQRVCLPGSLRYFQLPEALNPASEMTIKFRVTSGDRSLAVCLKALWQRNYRQP